VPEGSRGSWLDKLRSGPTRVSGPALRAAIDRLKSVPELGITLPAAARIPESRIAVLARFANRAKVTLITRMPPARRLARLAAFVHSLKSDKRRLRMIFWKCWGCKPNYLLAALARAPMTGSSKARTKLASP